VIQCVDEVEKEAECPVSMASEEVWEKVAGMLEV